MGRTGELLILVITNLYNISYIIKINQILSIILRLLACDNTARKYERNIIFGFSTLIFEINYIAQRFLYLFFITYRQMIRYCWLVKLPLAFGTLSEKTHSYVLV